MKKNIKGLHSDLELIACPICNEQDYTEHLFVDNSFNIVRCKQCGLVYVNPQPTIEDLVKKYNEKTGLNEGSSVSYPHGLKVYTGFEYAHMLKANIRSRIIRKYRKEGRILEIGCSVGYFLKVMRDQGYKTYGVEIFNLAADYGKKNFNLNIFCGDVSSADFANEEFDIVTMFDVISHLRAPIRTLKEINRILKVDGLLVFETGNKGEFDSKEQITKWGDEWGPEEHLFHYSRKALRKLLKKTGFEVLEINTYPVIISSLVEANMLKIIEKNKVFETKLSVESLGLKTYLMKLYGILHLFLKYELSKLLRGLNVDSTMIWVCKKLG